jgi:hypothetical protein
MTDEEIRIAIAEACGLFRIAPLKRTTRRMKDDPNGVRLWYCDHHHGGAAEYAEVPFYPTDLNAMNEAEDMLTFEELDRYCEYLGGEPSRCSRATARQRAEAFLRTLNLWKE